MTLKAVASYDLWIWHALFSLLAAMNDFNVLDISPIFEEYLEGETPNVEYKVNSHEYKMDSYVTDGIYAACANLIKTISLPQGEKNKNYAKLHKAFREDVERAFGVFQFRFAILSIPTRVWNHGNLTKIMQACVIMYNIYWSV